MDDHTRSALEDINSDLVQAGKTKLSLNDLMKNTKTIQARATQIKYDGLMASIEHELKNDNRAKAVLNGNLMTHSGDWLNLYPSKYLNQVFTSQEFLFLSRYRLGVPLTHKTKVCVNCNKDSSDSYGDHASGCKYNGLLFRRHENIKKILVQSCREGHLLVSEETLGYCAESNKRPGDLTIHGYETNLDLLIDVTVVSSLQNVSKASQEPGFNAKNTEKAKRGKYQNELNLNPDIGNNLSFQPFVVETLGGWTQVADEIIDKIAMAQSYYQEIPYKKLACSIRRKITTSLSKDLCTMWFSSLC